MRGTNGNSGTKVGHGQFVHEQLVPYKQPRKPIVSASERERNRKSLKSYFVNGDEPA